VDPTPRAKLLAAIDEQLARGWALVRTLRRDLRRLQRRRARLLKPGVEQPKPKGE
jgi:hypothetical protein